MLSLPSAANVYLCVRPVDLRKGFDGLSALVELVFGRNVLDGHLFLFINKRRDRLKILHFEEGGYWLYYRLLEAGTFEELASPDPACPLEIDATQLVMLLSGVSLQGSTHRRKRFMCATGTARQEEAA
jgi:hypothetical protein